MGLIGAVGSGFWLGEHWPAFQFPVAPLARGPVNLANFIYSEVQLSEYIAFQPKCYIFYQAFSKQKVHNVFQRFASFLCPLPRYQELASVQAGGWNRPRSRKLLNWTIRPWVKGRALWPCRVSKTDGSYCPDLMVGAKAISFWRRDEHTYCCDILTGYENTWFVLLMKSLGLWFHQ